MALAPNLWRRVGFAANRSTAAVALGARGASLSASAALRSPAAPAHAAGSADWHATTILSVRKDGDVCLIGDGQVSMGGVVVKGNARKVRRLGEANAQPVSTTSAKRAPSTVLAGFAGATADAMTLFERLEGRIEEHPGQLLRACVELAKDWRMDKYLRRLDAVILVADKDLSLMLTGTGDVLEPAGDGVQGIGSGGQYAIAAARALMTVDGLSAEEIGRRAMGIAADMCVYTNHNFVVETIKDAESGTA